MPHDRAQSETDILNVLRWHLGFHVICAQIGALHLGLLLYLCLFHAPSNFLAIALALFFFEVFAYAVLSFYLGEKRKFQLLHLGRKYHSGCCDRCREAAHPPLATGEQLEALSHQLHGLEFRHFPRSGRWYKALGSLERLGAWWHAEDVRALREWLLLAAVECYVQHIRIEPLALMSHTRLATTCIYLADLWLKPVEGHNENSSLEDASLDGDRARVFLQVALEEFILLTESSSPTPELYQQIAACYQRLDEREKQAESYERVLELDSTREDIRLQLGQLYFALGYQRKGLEIYAYFKDLGDERAQPLLQHYGAQRVFSLKSMLRDL